MSISIINHSAAINHTVAVVLDKELPARTGISNFFPRQTIATNMVSTLIKKNKNYISLDIVNYGEGKFNKESKVQENFYVPPVYEEGYFFDTDSLYMTTVANGLLTSVPANNQIAQKALNQMRLNREMIERSIIKQQWDFATTGIVVLKNGDNVNYQRSAASIVDITSYGATYWNDSALSHPLDDYQKAGAYLRNKGRSKARTFYSIMKSSTYNLLVKNTEIKELLNSRRANRAELHMPEIDLVSGMNYQGTLSTTDFEIILVTYDDSYLSPTTNLDVDFLADNLVVNIPTDFKGATIFAALKAKGMANVGVNANVPVLKEAEYSLRDFWDDRSLTGGLLLNSSPLVMPVDVDLIHTMKVLA